MPGPVATIVGAVPPRWLNGPLGDVLNRNAVAVAQMGSADAATASVEIRPGRPGAPTIMAFGGMAHGLTMPVAEFTRVLSGLDVTVIFVKDFRQCWYQRGVRGLARDPEASAHALRRLVPGDSHLLGTVGTSAGGTGAIMFGALLGVPHVLAFAPRTRITRAVIAQKRATGTPVPGFRIRAPFCDLRALLLAHPVPQLAVHVGGTNREDTVEARHLAGIAGVTIVEHPIGTHTVAAHLRDEGRLRDVLVTGLAL